MGKKGRYMERRRRDHRESDQSVVNGNVFFLCRQRPYRAPATTAATVRIGNHFFITACTSLVFELFLVYGFFSEKTTFFDYKAITLL